MRTIADPPPVLCVRGTVRPGDVRAVAVVRTRRAGAYGALITACAALEQGRDVFAVPGPIFDPRTSAPLGLLQDSAAPVTRAEDVLEALGWPAERVAIPEAVPRLDGEEEQVFAHLELTPQTPDAVAARRQLSAVAVARSLVALECRGLVMALPGQRYVRRFAGGAME